MNDIIGGIIVILTISALILPLVLTLVNFINLFLRQPIKPLFTSSVTLILGSILTIFLYGNLTLIDYDLPLHVGPMYDEAHAPVASWHMPTILFLAAIGITALLIVILSNGKFPPLMLLISFSGMIIGCALALTWIMQLSPHLFDDYGFPIGNIYLCVFPFNYIILCISTTIRFIREFKAEENEDKYNNLILRKCNRLIKNSKSWPVLVLLLTIPLLTAAIIILVLLGQQPDAAIKAFTETSEWLLSQKISPPPVIVNESHYLCTVSLRGHRRVVKPLRYGLRHDNKIIVNRQLCVANAFEDLLKERFPKGHRVIRYIYDKYGYPLSKHIKTPLSADVVYILMKPLEWIFVAVLYLMDRKPENRIAGQYLPYRLY